MKSGDIICDSSALISLADSCLLPSLKTIKAHLKGEIYISKRVEYESITHPMQIHEYALAALRLKQALVEGTIRLIDTKNAQLETRSILQHANSVYSIDDRPLTIIQEGEAEMLALAHELGISNILMDERTMRMLSEDPEGLRKHFEHEFGKEVEMSGKEVSWFRDFTRGMSIFRSSEIIVAAYELGFFKNYGEMEREALEASLYALKYAGCSISFEEISDFLKESRR